MCGITGKISFTTKDVSEKEIVRMNRVIKHRGPDDAGIYISPNHKVGLGHQRLSIIDLSTAGHQPMNYMNRYWIVFNGEIYNYRLKRKELEKEGYSFKSNSDTEVILALYDQYKEDCVQHLRGMFAFAIYDTQEDILFCARDRLGKKPFKFYLKDNFFIFASELKSILTQPEYTKEPDLNAIHHYLTLLYTPDSLTGFKDIQKLKPGHYLKINLHNKKIDIKRYWTLDYSKKQSLSENEWQKKILDKLKESVQVRMLSDVPIGAFLSGGIDSSAIVALMSELSNTPIKTFSIGFEEEKFNELPYARNIANLYKTDHTEFIVKPNAIEDLPMLVKQYEEPYADSSALPTYYLSKLTRKHVTVGLNGDGGDENFAGYPWYSVQKFGGKYEKVSTIHEVLVNPIITILAKKYPSTFMDRVRLFSKTINQSYNYRYLNYRCSFTNEMKNALYHEDFRKQVGENDTYALIASQFLAANTQNKLDQMLYTDIQTYLPDDLLTKVDIASMANSLEGRSPFLDHEFMEMTAQIPFNLKLKGLNNKKYILKKSLEKLLPHDILYRKKMGFSVPLENWFRSELKEYIHSNLLSTKALNRNIYKKEYVKKMLNLHDKSKGDYSKQLWTLLSLELWFQEYFD